MKRFYLLFTTFILGTALFAEQPFFLKNWIIPEDVVWGEKNTIPLIDGVSFRQGWEDSELTFLEIESSEQAKVDLPPYFLEKNLAGWDMTYEQILNAFKTSDEFDVYEDIVKGKTIVLLDDIFDSGATLKEVGKILTRKGAKCIVPIVIAKTVGGTL